ncbi:MAG: hypothetical protein AB1742_15820 [bacterium]
MSRGFRGGVTDGAAAAGTFTQKPRLRRKRPRASGISSGRNDTSRVESSGSARTRTGGSGSGAAGGGFYGVRKAMRDGGLPPEKWSV